MKGVSLFKDRIYPVIFMVIITVVFIGIVSAVYLSTRDLVVLNESLFLKKAVLYAAGIPIPADGREAERLFKDRIQEVAASDGRIRYYEILSEYSGEVDGYAFIVSGPGLWGEIQAVLAFENDLSTLKGLEFTRQNETPGLGARIAEPWFKEQFRGKVGPFILVPEGEAAAGNEIDAITGATRTSTAVQTIVNNTVRDARRLLQEGN